MQTTAIKMNRKQRSPKVGCVPLCISGMMNLGYTGKPYDTATGLYSKNKPRCNKVTLIIKVELCDAGAYNYGYRDYKPTAARFTTVDPIRDGSNWYAYVNNDPVNWIDLWGLWDEALGNAVENNTKPAQQYKRGTNDCDIWVETVVNQSGYQMPSTWTPAANTTVKTHIENMKNELQNQPSEGANLIFHNNNHAMIGYLNKDGTFDVAHNTSNPNSDNRIFLEGNSESLSYDSVADFEAKWDGANKPIYYFPLKNK